MAVFSVAFATPLSLSQSGWRILHSDQQETVGLCWRLFRYPSTLHLYLLSTTAAVLRRRSIFLTPILCTWRCLGIPSGETQASGTGVEDCQAAGDSASRQTKSTGRPRRLELTDIYRG